MPSLPPPSQSVDETARLREELTWRRDERGGADRGFAHPREARLTLPLKRVRNLLATWEWFEPSRHLNAIWHNLHLVVCTFLLIEDLDWSSFGEYVSMDDATPRLRDELLPFSPAVLAHLPAQISQASQKWQYTFLSITIDCNWHSTYNHLYRLPFICDTSRQESRDLDVLQHVEVEAGLLVLEDGRSCATVRTHFGDIPHQHEHSLPKYRSSLGLWFANV